MLATDRCVWTPGQQTGGSKLRLATHVDFVFKLCRFHALNR